MPTPDSVRQSKEVLESIKDYDHRNMGQPDSIKSALTTALQIIDEWEKMSRDSLVKRCAW